MSSSSSFTSPKPLHPSILPRLHPDYIAFHNSHAFHLSPIEQHFADSPGRWSPSLRTRGVGGLKMGRDPVEGVCQQEISLTWGEEMDVALGLGEGHLGMRQGKINVGVFWPKGRKDVDDPLPVFIYCPGGGFVLPTPSTSSFITRLALLTPCIVLVPRPRLAPEHPFPTAIEEVWGFMRWVLGGRGREEWTEKVGDGIKVDWERVALGGASAGGNVAAVMATRLAQISSSSSPDRSLFKPLLALLLFNPVLDNSADTQSAAYLSWSENQHCPDLPATSMLFFRSLYLPLPPPLWPSTSASSDPSSAPSPPAPDDLPLPLTHPLLSPIHSTPTTLDLLPPLWICLGGCDLVRDEGVVFAQKVRTAKRDRHLGQGGREDDGVEEGDEGGEVRLKVYDGYTHGYTIQDGVLEVGREFVDDVRWELRRVFYGKGGAEGKI